MNSRGIATLPLIGVIAALVVLIGAAGWITVVGKNAGGGDIAIGGDTDGTDTDGDGLADWEEELWGTDINNPDTDGDGTSDGDEINQGRNPHIVGPNDSLPETEILFDTNSSATVTPTDLLARDILLGTLLLHQASGTPQERQRLIEQAFAETLSGVSSPQEITSSDLIVVAESDVNAQQYHDELVAALSTYSPTERQAELTGLYEILQEESTDEDLNRIAEEHRERAQTLTNISVPGGAVNFHIQIVNYFYQLAESTKILSQKPRPDTLFLLAAVGTYRGALENELPIHESLTDYFSTHGITFAQNAGEVLFK